jgi:hypothetical protein
MDMPAGYDEELPLIKEDEAKLAAIFAEEDAKQALLEDRMNGADDLLEIARKAVERATVCENQLRQKPPELKEQNLGAGAKAKRPMN